MSEVVISRRGGKKSKGYLMTEYIESNRQWVVPEGVVNNEFNVRIFSGGYGNTFDFYGFSGGGCMNNAILKLTPGESINITVGEGAFYKNDRNWSSTGQPTSFGTYLSAFGMGSSGYCGKKAAIKVLQFGSGDGATNAGVWGGCGGSHFNTNNDVSNIQGGYYGGGGGGICSIWIPSGWGGTEHKNSTNGGYYGGGGGGYFSIGNKGNSYHIFNIAYFNGGYGGVYDDNGIFKQSGLAGNGAMYHINAENGTDTTSMNIKDDMGLSLTGKGLASNLNYNSQSSYKEYYPMVGGGGGYGGNGGNFVFKNVEDYLFGEEDYNKCMFYTGCGGGGYGSNGGNGAVHISSYTNANVWGFKGGGGGGYGGDGEDGGYSYQGFIGAGGGYGKVSVGKNGGGGGYYCPGGGMNRGNGCGGGFGIWSNNTLIKTYACGRSDSSANAEPGVCVIQYYLKVD